MIYSNVDFNVVYVDPSIGTAGDGTTPAGALKALPANAADFADNTCYLIRRTQESYATIIPNGENTNITNLLLLGMPNPSDLMYDFVPEEAKSAWGTDEAEYANVKSVVADGRFQEGIRFLRMAEFCSMTCLGRRSGSKTVIDYRANDGTVNNP